MPSFFATLESSSIIFAFFLANIIMGIWAYSKRRTNTFADYTLANKDLPTIVLMMTLVGTYLSGGEIGKIDRFYAYGLVHILPSAAVIFSFLVIGNFIAPKLIYFDNKLTAGSLMREFYGPKAQVFTGFLSLLSCILMITIQISVMGRLATIVLDIRFSTAIILCGGLTILYSMWGGLRSVSYTDIIQMITFFVFFSAITAVVVSKVGGLGPLFKQVTTKIPEKLRVVGDPNFTCRLKSALFWGLPFSFVISPPVIHRMLVTQNKRQVRRMWYGSAFIFLCIVLMMLIISFSFLVAPRTFGLHKKIDLLPHMIRNVFYGRPMILGCMFIGMISMVLSTIDSFLHTAGIVLVEDVLEPIKDYCNREETDTTRKIIYARISIGLIGMLAMVIGLQINNALHMITGKFLMPTILIYASVNIPLIFGILGFKTDRVSWLSFTITYMGSLGMLLFLKINAHATCNCYFDYFLIASPLSIVAYLLTHVYVNGGIIILHRKKDTIAEQLWVPRLGSLKSVCMQGINGFLRLPFLAQREVDKYKPTQSLGFGLIMLSAYMLGAITLWDSQRPFMLFIATVRVIGMTLSCILILEELWPVAAKKYFPLYWLVTVFYCLPFASTLVFLHIHKVYISYTFFIGSFVLLAFLVSSHTFFWMSFVGLVTASGTWYYITGGLSVEFSQGRILLIVPTILIIFLVLILVLKKRSEAYNEDKMYMIKAVTSALLHETNDRLRELIEIKLFTQKLRGSMRKIESETGEKGYFLSETSERDITKKVGDINGNLEQIICNFTRFTELLDEDISIKNQENMRINTLITEVLPTLPKKYIAEVQKSMESNQDFDAFLLEKFFGDLPEDYKKECI